MIVAGIDIGSNTTRLLIADVADGKIAQILHSERNITRLGAEINRTGRLAESSVTATLEALSGYSRALDTFPVERIKAVATSAVRESSNADDLLIPARKLGIPVEVISGDLESKLTFLGVTAGIPVADCKPLIFDIGGGSTEFITAAAGEVTFKQSIKLGVVKLADMFDVRSPVTPDVSAKCRAYINNMLDDVMDKVGTPDTLIASAGTPTTLAAIDMQMAQYDWQKVNGYTLNYETVTRILTALSAMSAPERLMMTGLEQGREDLIVPGTMIIRAVMKRTGVQQLTVSDFGLREGVALAASME